MALFRRRRSPQSDSAVAVDEFWAQWPGLRADLAASVDSGKPVTDEAADRLTECVTRIHPALKWEVSAAPRATGDLLGDFGLSADDDPDALMARMAELDDPLAALGGGASYALTLSAGPDDQARILAERWARAAPDEPDWRFLPAFPADHDKLGKPLSWDGHELDLAHCTVSLRVDHQQGRIEAGVYHPDFMFVPEETRNGVADHVVMLALGEDDYVRWIGRVEALAEKPLDPLPPTSIPAVVQQLSGALGSGGWVTLQGRVPLRGLIEIAVRQPLHRRDFPALTLYVLAVVPYAEANDDKLPAGSSASALDALTTRLRDLLGDNGALLAQQTAAGQRQLHFYLDPDSGALPELEQAVRTWPEGRAAVQSRLDPEWDVIDQLLRPIKRQLGR
ncbi:DUF695 domain-containing protein [Nocardiopsis mangrovi]|uniref:DUF695 domain-containing protein n=1 Tax=Nocardiopsis mangrovi TaxID=1179818 RepID=A0ABV9DX46_9ACTN